MRGAASALAFMHEAGVVHRSLGAPSLRINTLGEPAPFFAFGRERGRDRENQPSSGHGEVETFLSRQKKDGFAKQQRNLKESGTQSWDFKKKTKKNNYYSN